jgi:hypothetical protein
MREPLSEEYTLLHCQELSGLFGDERLALDILVIQNPIWIHRMII